MGSMGLQDAVWGLLEGSSLPAAGCVGRGPPSSALTPPLTKWGGASGLSPSCSPDAFLMLGKVRGSRIEVLSLLGQG